MGDPVELADEGSIQFRDPVPEGRDPKGRDGVEVAPAVDVDQLVALGALDDHR
jgi:hypothetical protein